MNSPRTAVIFDANAYRELVLNKSESEVIDTIGKLRQSEAANDIVGVGLVITAIEMLGNLVEGEGGINYRDCLHGLIAMAHHCNENDEHGPRIIPHPYLHLTRSFFDELPEDMVNKVLNVGGTLADFKTSAANAVAGHACRGTFENVKLWLDTEESNFAAQIEQLVEGARNEISQQYPKASQKDLTKKLLAYLEAPAYKHFIALSIIMATAQTLGKNPSIEDATRLAIEMCTHMPLTVGFYQWVCIKVVDDNIDMQSKKSRKKRWNWLWDYQVTFVVANTQLNSRKTLVVTSDKGIIEVLNKYGFQDRVVTLQDYFTKINFKLNA